VYRFGKEVDLKVLWLDCLDEEMWLQEYCCQFLSLASQWIATEFACGVYIARGGNGGTCSQLHRPVRRLGYSQEERPSRLFG